MTRWPPNGEWLSLTDKTTQIADMLENTMRLIAAKECRKRKETQRRQAEAMHQFEGCRPPAFSKAYERRPGFYRANRDMMLAFYHGYELINRICWNGSLPQVAISLNLKKARRRKNGAMTLAFATNGNGTRVTHNGAPLHRITLNVSNLIAASNQLSPACSNFANDFWGVFVHEMIHIWQFAARRRSGHGKDFYAEGRRIGYDEKNHRLDDLLLSILPSLARQSENFSSRFRDMLQNPGTHSPRNDLRFFFEEIN